MAGPGGRRRDVAWVAPGDGADYITALPLELRARIAGFLPFPQVPRLAILSRPWRHIHRQTSVVDLNLEDFLFFTEEIVDGHTNTVPNLKENALAGLEIALLRRGQDKGSGSKVDTLKIAYYADDTVMSRHAGLIIALSDARKICVTSLIARVPRLPLADWLVDLSPAARDLEIHAFFHLAPTVAGPGAAALRALHLEMVVLREWPSQPSLRSLTLQHVRVKAPFPTDSRSRYPRLEHMCIVASIVDLDSFFIVLPLLKSLRMDSIYFSPRGRGRITVDSPELEELDVACPEGYADADYSFTLRAPRLRCLTWSDQFVEPERVHIDAGKPGAVTSGRIEFMWSRRYDYSREMKDFRTQMMRMLQGLLPNLPPECLADAARPYITLHECISNRVASSGVCEPIPTEKLACDLSALMSSLKL